MRASGKHYFPFLHRWEKGTLPAETEVTQGTQGHALTCVQPWEGTEGGRPAVLGWEIISLSHYLWLLRHR